MAAAMIGVVVSLIVLEVFLKVARPFPALASAGRVELPVNTTLRIEDHGHEGLNDPIDIRFNSLGFRGPEPSADQSVVRIVTVGGSTTQCLYLSEGQTWPDQVAKELSAEGPDVWINNAGLDGHSTFGHLQLMDHVQAADPDIILFYVGINDVDRIDLNGFDKDLARGDRRAEESFLKTCYRKLVDTSECVCLLDAWRRHRQAASRGLTHFSSIDHGDFEDAATVQWSDAERQRRIDEMDERAVSGYAKRLEGLIARANACGAVPVLMTQAVLFGDAVDPVTGTDLSRVKIGSEDGFVLSRKLEVYNQVTRDTARKEDVLLIDLASELPKSSAYYYDWIHNNNAGASAIGGIVASQIEPLIRSRLAEKTDGASFSSR